MAPKAVAPVTPQPVDFLREIADFTFTSKYARYNEKEHRRETWAEAVDRLEKMHLKRFSWLAKEDIAQIRWAFDRVREKLVVPSMRSLQFGGKAIEAHEARTFNCSVRHIDSIRAFAESWYLLLCGCGLGIGLSTRYLDRLPDLVGAADKTGTVITYVIEDSIEGWADSIEALLMCYFKNTACTGRKIVFDYSKIRKKGSPLKTGGGKAPGYRGLKQAHQRVKALLDYIIEEKEQRRLKTINAYDILMHCADAVLSGGIRRSATSVVFDPTDDDMMNAKTFFKIDKARRFAKDDETGLHHGQVVIGKRIMDVALNEWDYAQLKEKAEISWFHVEPQRARSNNSVLLLRDTVTLDQFRAVVERTRQFGEPGFVFANESRQLFNPCQPASAAVEIEGRGIATIGDVVIGSRIRTVEKGELGWTKVLAKWFTGVKPVYEYRTAHGVFVGTQDHQVVENGVKACASRAKAVDVWHNGSLVTEEVLSSRPLGDEGVFDLSVECGEHVYLTSNCLVSNCFEIGFIPVTDDGVCGTQFCNLTSQNGAKIDSAERFRDATVAATIIGTLQATYTRFPYLSNTAAALTEDEALLGVSITGMMDNPQVLLDPALQRQMAELAVKVNAEWAAKLGIRQAARITCVKPEGTSSLVLSSASGIHPHHARRYFRRIQCNRTDNVYRFLRKANPHAVEESVWSANKTDDVVTFPITVPEQAMIKADLTAIRHLEIIRSTQQNWVLPGTTRANHKPIEHNVSCTVMVRDEEWQQVVEYLFNNRDHFAAVSLLPATGDKLYKQAPLEAVATEEDEKRWADLVGKWVPVDYTKLVEDDDDTQVQAEAVCAGGSCEVR